MSDEINVYSATDWSDYLDQILADLQSAYRQPDRHKQLIVELNDELAMFGLAWSPSDGLSSLYGGKTS